MHAVQGRVEKDAVSIMYVPFSFVHDILPFSDSNIVHTATFHLNIMISSVGFCNGGCDNSC